jgi:hypothetical protein
VIDVETCIQCGLTADEIGAGHPASLAMLLTRPRPLGVGDYQICLDCARRIRKEQDERAQEAIRVAERSGV